MSEGMLCHHGGNVYVVFLSCVVVLSGYGHLLYVKKYWNITLRWGCYGLLALRFGPPRLAPHCVCLYNCDGLWDVVCCCVQVSALLQYFLLYINSRLS